MIWTPSGSHTWNGLAERFSQTRNDRIRRIVADMGYNNWIDSLSEALSAIQTTPHSITGYTPREFWTWTVEIWDNVRARTGIAREHGNDPLQLYDHTYSIGDKVWPWDHERMKQRD